MASMIFVSSWPAAADERLALSLRPRPAPRRRTSARVRIADAEHDLPAPELCSLQRVQSTDVSSQGLRDLPPRPRPRAQGPWAWRPGRSAHLGPGSGPEPQAPGPGPGPCRPARARRRRARCRRRRARRRGGDARRSARRSIIATAGLAGSVVRRLLDAIEHGGRDVGLGHAAAAPRRRRARRA